MTNPYEISDWAREKLHEIIDDENREDWAHRLIYKFNELNKDAPKFNTQKSTQQQKQLHKILSGLSDSVIDSMSWKAGINDYEQDDYRLDAEHYQDNALDNVRNAICFLKKYSAEPFMPPVIITKHALLKILLPRIMGIPFNKFTPDDFAKDSEAAEILDCVYQETGSTNGMDAAYKALQRLSKDKKPTSTFTELL